MLLDGIDMAKLKRVPRYERPSKNRSKDRALVNGFNDIAISGALGWHAKFVAIVVTSLSTANYI
jgi:hypothetical protein